MKIINKLPKHYIEHGYLDVLIPHLDKDVFKDKILYITYKDAGIEVKGKNVIVFQTAGKEESKVPKYANKVGLVFKHHLDKNRIQNVYHIPLPYGGGFTADSSIPMSQRKYDISFMGMNSAKRRQAVNYFLQYAKKTKRNVYVKTTKKWGTGLPIDEYGKIMANSKIAFSPSGMKRAECVRFTEAVKCGCAIIACKHPNVRVFNNCPAVYTDNWKNLGQIIENIIPKLDEIHEKMKLCWEQYFSPRAVAEYMNKVTKQYGN